MKAFNKREKERKKLLEVVRVTKGERKKRRGYEIKKGDEIRNEEKEKGMKEKEERKRRDEDVRELKKTDGKEKRK